MRTQYYVASSLDGFIADSNNSLDWLLQFGEVAGERYERFLANVGALAMGSTTYEWLLEHHLQLDSDSPQAWPYEQPTWVFSSRVLPRVEGANLYFASGDVRPAYDKMAEVAGERNLWIVGGGKLAGQFYDRALLDEIIVSIAPVLLGDGVPLLPYRIARPPLVLREITPITPFVELQYQVNYNE
ncbi:dihydrofolate reductase family protein [Oscillatoria sp. FACHB-1406]|uniref:dihydrofolate reductase family protein n=1 Tax=Oscillatoria sp. FACHB-1406 TaxID=2692846 RepID=UPI00168A3574|nr:dihydrofolate reductase family protein [Oscillatoria sp. FACHB-1406]MBD2578997.1 dihydrofolate reductase [Oscillatoria sp. FACHB-1406]